MRSSRIFVSLVAIAFTAALAGCQNPAVDARQSDPYLAKFDPAKAPVTRELLLNKGDRLAICGDSITEQKIYSRIMETYLTVCTPELEISVRQYGWSGEKADGFFRRMTSDCLRFQPTIATTCYGMNDYRYKPYDDSIGKAYRENYTAVVEAFKNANVRVVLGSAGCVGKVASWVKTASGTLDEHNVSLCKLRNIAIEIANKQQVAFADVYWPMLTGAQAGRKKYGPQYELPGKDGVHPGGAGHLVMAYAFLKAMGLNGDIGTFTVDLAANSAQATDGHKVHSFKDGVLTITSTKYPFCAADDPNSYEAVRSGMTLVPFNQELNRLMLVVKGGKAAKYKVTWGNSSMVYTAAQLAQGVNLADDFAANPFLDAFKKVDAAVFAKQDYETTQVKKIFHGKEGKADMNAAVKNTEATRVPLVAAIHTAFVPVTHAIRIEEMK